MEKSKVQNGNLATLESGAAKPSGNQHRLRQFISTASVYVGNSALMAFLKRIHGVGIFLGLICGVSYSLGGLIVKILNSNYKMHAIMLYAIRQAFLIFFAGPQVAYCEAPYFGKGERRERLFLLLRAACGSISTTLNFMAISYLPLGDAGVIFATTPFLTTLLARVLLGERCRFSDLPVFILAFLGVICILRPPFLFTFLFPTVVQSIEDVSTEDRIKGCAYAFSGAVVQAGVYMSLRMLRQTNIATISFVYAMCSAPIMLMIAFATDTLQMPPCYVDRAMAVAISLTAVGGHVFVTTAAKFIPPGIVSLTRTSEVAFGFIWQAAFLGVAVNVFSIFGCVLVLTSMAILSIRQVITEKYAEEQPNSNFIRFLLVISR